MKNSASNGKAHQKIDGKQLAHSLGEAASAAADNVGKAAVSVAGKSDKEYSPTTMYHDYSINENLFHWQSQSTTSETSPTGQRYIHHRQRGSKILLFVRETKNDLAGAAPYTFLGTANYVKHEGSRPMSITWKLDVPIPAKYLRKTNKLVVG